jgi:outer membrane protein OmpA-like peptidoglycan-associated protein
MIRRSRYHQTPEQLNIYQSFTDLMSNAFMILCLFLLLALIQSQQLNKRLQSASPIIINEKSGKFKFKSGSAELTPELKKYILNEILPEIKTIIKEREIDFIQVIGHTDGQENNRASNLDSTLESVAKGSQSVGKLNPGSNADLGLMRALAVVQELEKTGNLKNIKFRAYSAAQLYLPSGKLASIDRGADESRRRIEIRFIPPGKLK